MAMFQKTNGGIMIPKVFLLSSALTLLGVFASAQEINSATPDHGYPREQYWQCSAHNSHGEGQIYYGETSSSRHEAGHSAVDECQYHENHQCTLHECHLAGGY
jgi:hypothetical protein